MINVVTVLSKEDAGKLMASKHRLLAIMHHILVIR